MHIHHPSIETLSDYASGGLRLSHSLGIATHLEFCSECKDCVKKLEHVGAEIFNVHTEDSTQVEHCDDIKEAVFDRIFSETANVDTLNETQISVRTRSPKVPKSLTQFIPTNFDDLDWTRISPSIKVATLCNEKDGTQIALSCVKAGGKMPHHAHTGQEITVVLEGSFSDEDGIYSKGDFVLRDAKDKHKPIVSKDAQCICLMIQDSPIEFTGFFARLLNPIIRRSHYSH